MAEEIRRIVSELLLRELKDPRLSGLVAVSDVDVTNDGSYATLYVTAPGRVVGEPAGEEEKKDILSAFGSAKGFLRKEIGTRLQLRHTPDLIFKIDTSQEYGRHMEEIFSSLGITSQQPDAEAESGKFDENE
jgi:ribosome-binding factor A